MVTDTEQQEGGEGWTRDAAIELALSVAALVVVLAVFTRFVAWVEARPGAVLPDPILARLEPRDLTWITFSLIYAGLALGVISLVRHPRALAAGVRSYAVMVLFRMVMLAVMPLDPPAGMIPLQDPFVEHLGTHGQVLTRDLFFSGHTATMCIVTLSVRHPRLRWVLLACTIGVASCVVWQAVHYTVDVLAAPAFAYAAHRLVLAIGPIPARRGS
ncbi:MAG TPA: phosphatase PAP2-related protein [Anaeromyxobacter sp.]|nr:phosphatase PAP2-related protein [Anaeromyxobacter sp.]